MKSLLQLLVLPLLYSLVQCQSASHPSKWSEQKLNEWFEARRYLNGLQIIPDPFIDCRSFAVHYYDHKEVWDKAFSFLRNTDLAGLPLGRNELGDKMYATVSEYIPKDRDTTFFEAHKIMIDIHYVVSGKESIDVAPLESMTVIEPYNPDRELMFGTVAAFTELKAMPDRFFVIFPHDAHRPSVGEVKVFTRKIVIKFPM